MRACPGTMLFGVLSIFVLAASLLAAEHAPAADAVACGNFLSPLREAFGKKVGPSSCTTMRNNVTIEGRVYQRLDIGLNGSVDGYAAKTGAYKEYLTNAPDLVFPQTGNPGPLFVAVASYERDKGAAITMVLPSGSAAFPVDLNRRWPHALPSPAGLTRGPSRFA